MRSRVWYLTGGTLVCVLLIAWELLCRFNVVDTALVPSPSSVANALVQMGKENLLVSDLFFTLSRIVRGFLVGTSLGIVLGLATGLIRPLRLTLEPIVQILRPIPAVALVPLALIWFGIGEGAKLFIVGWASFFPTWLSTHSGVQRVPREFVWTAQVLGASPKRIVREVIFPWSLPFVLSGSRISLGLAFAATVVAEMSGASVGVGYRILASHLAFRPDRMIGGIILIGGLGAVLDSVFGVLVRRYLPWADER